MNVRKYNMTVSSVPSKFVWFRVAKAGTRSTLAALRAGVDKFDLDQGFRIPYDDKSYQEHYKFAFVRNPYTRIVSGWNDKIVLENGGAKLKKNEYRQLSNFDYFIDWLSDQDMQTVNIHFRPQALLVPEKIDFLGRLENFATDLPYVLNQLGIKTSHDVPHKNRKPHASLEDLISSSSKAAINRLFSQDFERFGYDIH